MRQRGQLAINNYTDQDWQLVTAPDGQPGSWSGEFPAVIPKLSGAWIPIEWEPDPLAFFMGSGATRGEARYAIGSTGKSIEIQAKPRSRGLQAAVTGQPETVWLGAWAPLGAFFHFELYGVNGNATSSFDARNWMSADLALLGRHTLREICMPGSHDAGMSRKTGGTPLGSEHATLTQTVDVLGQLNAGSRFFDIRPVIGDGTYKTGHYSKVALNWQGANGQPIDEIVDQVNAHLDAHPELVILYSKGSKNTQVGNGKYRDFNPDEWRGYFHRLLRLRHRFTGQPARDMTMRPIADFIGQGPCVLIMVGGADPGVLAEFRHEGIFDLGCLPIYDSYADSDHPERMIDDQIAKLHQQKTSLDAQMFLLSWTLTLQGVHNISGKSILERAKEVRGRLYDRLPRELSPQRIPNVLYLDAYDDPRIAGLAAAINHRFLA